MMTRAAPDAIAWSSLVVLGGVLVAWSWLTWPDLLIDFGREAYVAWRLGEADTLYRDVAYLNGPLSPYWNALVLRTTGLGMGALFFSNALVLMAIVVAIQLQLTALADRFSAWAASASFLLIFAFARYADIGNYSYLAPYSHEATHGLLLALVALGCVARTQRSRGGQGSAESFWSAASGLLLGAVAMTKIELLVALTPAVVLGLVLSPGDRAGGARRLAGRSLLPAFCAAWLLPMAAWTLLTLATPLTGREALDGISRGLAGAFDARLTGLPFYQWGAGLDDLPGNLILLLNTLGLQLGLLAPGLLAGLHLRTRRPAAAVWLCAGLGGALLLALRDNLDWLAAARPLPLYLLALLVWRSAPLLRGESGSQSGQGPAPVDRKRAAAELPLIVFAALLLAKLGLNARVYHYGFVLAMPATLVLVVALLSWIPRELDRHGRCGMAFRVWSASLLAATALAHVDLGTQLLPTLRSALGEGADRIHGDSGRAGILRAALAEVEREVGEGGKLLVVPEGVMLNYLSRRRAPTPFISFTPFDLIVWGQDEMIRALRRSPADAVLLVHRDTGEYGATFFGRDYGDRLSSWIHSRYRRVQRFGGAPLQPGTGFGVELWLARTGAPNARAD